MPPYGTIYHGLVLLLFVSLMIISTRQSINTVGSSLGDFDISDFGGDISEWVNEAGDEGGGDEGAVEIPSHRSIGSIGMTASTIQAVALLRGLKTFGVVRLTQIGSGPTQISGFVKGLFPFGKHGFHVHQHRVVGYNCESAGEHYNPTRQNHGPKDSPSSHIGDLGNLHADAKGAAKFDVSSTRISLRGKFSVLERSLVVHLQTDDLGAGYNRESLQSGNSGARIACGTIKFIAIKKA